LSVIETLEFLGISNLPVDFFNVLVRKGLLSRAEVMEEILELKKKARK